MTWLCLNSRAYRRHGSMRVCKPRLRVRRVRVVVARTASLRGKVEGSNIMLAYSIVRFHIFHVGSKLTIAACADILETVSIPILPLNNLPHILGTIMCLASLIDMNILCAGTPATKG